MTKAPDEVAKWFSAINAMGGANFASEVYPGDPGTVIVDGKVRLMNWGFPLTLNSKKTGQPLKPRPVNNTRSDKLDSYMWRYSFEERRCLIPASAWAEAEGPRVAEPVLGFLSLIMSYSPVQAFGTTVTKGASYSIVLTDSAGEATTVHNRTPVIIRPEHYNVWNDGPPDEAKELCVPWQVPVQISRTEQRWSGN